MVDAALSRSSRAPEGRTRSLLTGLAGAAAGALLEEYLGLCGYAAVAPAQDAAWVAAWLRQIRPDGIVALLRRGTEAVAGLALEVVPAGPFKVARLLGGRHANGNFPPLAAGAEVGRADLMALAAAVSQARPDVDVLSLERMLDGLDGRDNPWLALGRRESPNLSLAVDLAGGFDAALERSGGKKRKRHRSQLRKLQEAGAVRRVEARTPEESDRLLDAFFAMKEARFAKLGITDVFADPAVRRFFRELFAGAAGTDARPFVLHGLEVGGRLRAVTGSSRCGDRLVCEFGAIAEDELSHTSPGDFLFFDNIEEAGARGFAVYDFSVGDDPYKRRWCDIERRDADVVLALTVKGRTLSSLMKLEARAKAFVKGNPAIWGLAKRLRQRTAGRTVEPEAAEG